MTYPDVFLFSRMSWFVYMIKSEVDGTIYKGVSENFIKRLNEHNLGLTQFTSSKKPWSLIYVEKMNSKRDALIREKKLKRQNRKYLTWLIDQPNNLLKK
jgi:putative endonuclease